ncbi:VWA domain-containing protein [Bacillus sp. E(2018)]|uniref:VWA domain-containing protein n=1 Tax=Bacillus sp. E(2018) TaxID=2502239 RepID=UPI0010F5FAD0|nr:VWA domain-containing protein [Bacillus sp. E(2018)]
MSFRNLKTLSFLFLLLTLFTGCANSEEANEPADSKKEVKQETKKESKPEKVESDSKLKKDIPPAPTSINEVFAYPNGKFAGKEVYDTTSGVKEELLKDMPKLDENASDETLDLYFNNLVALYWNGFTDPATLVDKWKLYSFGSPEIEDPKFQFKENYNVEIILDASGSMAKKVKGKTQMELAKEAIDNFVQSLPDKANVGLRVYGHKGSGSDSDKKLSCESSNLVYPIASYNAAEFDKALNQFQPKGWTPITLALEEAQKDLSKYPADKNNNIVFLVSDGIETCEGDPVIAAKKLVDSNISPIVNVIGFNVDGKGQKQLKDVAAAAGGIYTDINDQTQLKKEFERVEEIAKRWEQWKKDSLREADAIKVERYFEALGFTNEWDSKKRKLSINISGSITYLSNEDYITREQREILEDKEEKLDEFIEKSGLEVENYLNSMNEKTFEQMKQDINEKYKLN